MLTIHQRGKSLYQAATTKQLEYFLPTEATAGNYIAHVYSRLYDVNIESLWEFHLTVIPVCHCLYVIRYLVDTACVAALS